MVTNDESLEKRSSDVHENTNIQTSSSSAERNGVTCCRDAAEAEGTRATEPESKFTRATEVNVVTTNSTGVVAGAEADCGSGKSTTSLSTTSHTCTTDSESAIATNDIEARVKEEQEQECTPNQQGKNLHEEDYTSKLEVPPHKDYGDEEKKQKIRSRLSVLKAKRDSLVALLKDRRDLCTKDDCSCGYSCTSDGNDTLSTKIRAQIDKYDERILLMILGDDGNGDGYCPLV